MLSKKLSKKVPDTRSFAKDQFSERLCILYTDLVNRKAIAKRQYFTDVILRYTSAAFHKVENNTRNFPADPSKREDVIRNLKAEYNVNPEYMRGNSEKMYTADPPVIVNKVRGETDADISLYALPKRKKLLEENEELKEQILYLEEQLATARKELEKYKKKSDNNPDK